MNTAICSDSMQPNNSQLTRSCNAPAHIHSHVKQHFTTLSNVYVIHFEKVVYILR